MKKLKKTSKISIPLSKNQEDSSIEIKRFVGDSEQLIELIFRTSNSSVSHSLSLNQYELLRKAIREFEVEK